MANRYTVYAKWPKLGVVEEIDVDALDADQAKVFAEVELDENYMPGYEIIACEKREGLYF